MVLEAIVAHKREELRRKRDRLTAVDPGSIPPSDRSLQKALQHPHTGFILECKKASPSKGLIRPDFDPRKIALTYSAYADAISVLTDEKFFQGHLDYLGEVRDCTRLPVLCKDIIVDPLQVIEARIHGADAVLLMLSVLGDEEFVRCFEQAQSLGLDAVVEVHTEDELQRALRLGAQIIGINNRNLNTLEIDLQTSERLAPRIPRGTVVIAESGITTHADVVRLRPFVDGFLVGSSLMGRADLDRACRELVYGRVKVCGLTNDGDAATAHEAGALWGGMIFARRSPRCVTVDHAAMLRSTIDLNWVGVFVDEETAQVARTAWRLGLSAVQLHGAETPGYMAQLKKELPETCAVWKAALVGNTLPRDTSEIADRILLDNAAANGARGGSGQPFDWQLLAGRDLSSVIVAGGLSPQNAGKADALGAYGLDVNSMVESSPGRKDARLVNAFFAALRGEQKERQ